MTTTTVVEQVAEARRLVDLDWLMTRRWRRLHHAALTDDQLVAMWEDRCLWERVRLACGQTAAYVSIPGVLSRLSATRCPACCTALNYPPGTGSPKNDPDCRARLGLSSPTTEETHR